MPAMLKVRAQGKRQKLLQYAERIWGINSGNETSRMDAAIDKTRAFFEKMGLPTSFAGYGVTNIDIEQVTKLLDAHGMVNMGENNDVTLDMMREIMRLCSRGK